VNNIIFLHGIEPLTNLDSHSHVVEAIHNEVTDWMMDAPFSFYEHANGSMIVDDHTGFEYVVGSINAAILEADEFAICWYQMFLCDKEWLAKDNLKPLVFREFQNCFRYLLVKNWLNLYPGINAQTNWPITT
jgi:hypothetical protein